MTVPNIANQGNSIINYVAIANILIDNLAESDIKFHFGLKRRRLKEKQKQSTTLKILK